MTQLTDTIDVLKTLPESITAERKRRGLSFRVAAEQIGVTHSTLWGIETGHRDPGTVIVMRCLRWLDGDGP